MMYFTRIYNIILVLIQWFAGFFEDQRGRGSSKRIALFVNTFCLYQQNQYSMQKGAVTNNYFLMILFVLELVLLGVIGAEFFMKYGIPFLSKESIEKTVVESTDIINTNP